MGFGLVSLCGALALAELSSMLPHTGGVYVYLRAAYGDAAAFVFGWLFLLVATPAAIGALATFFAELVLRPARAGSGPRRVLARSRRRRRHHRRALASSTSWARAWAPRCRPFFAVIKVGGARSP